MPELREKAISNTFQIIEEFKLRRSFYTSPTKIGSFLKAQPPGKVKIFSEEEILLYKIKKRKEKERL